ncbi:hypothetical protein ACFVHQ_06315 [Actinomycetes bacterium NPDC127524]
MSYESKIKQIIKDTQSKVPEKRYKALDSLNKLKDNEEIGLDFGIFEDIIKAASFNFESTNEEWDDPSFQLIDFVSDYQTAEVSDAIACYYQGFSREAKIRALYYLCSFEEENNLSAIMDIFEKNLPSKNAVIVTEPLYDHPRWIQRIVEKFYIYLSGESYKYQFYDLLLYCYENELIKNFHPDYVYPLLLEDYEKCKKKYKSYHDSYNIKKVYIDWKENYIDLRLEIEYLLMNMNYHYNEKVQEVFDEVLTFKDPILQTRAFISTMEFKGIYDKNLLNELSKNIESTQLIYYGLHRLRKTHLFLAGENKQPYFARSYLFDYLMEYDEYQGVPFEVKIEDHLDIENDYGQQIRYYLSSFIGVDEKTYYGWVGAFPHEVKDSIDIWEGTYTELEEFIPSEIEEYKNKFIKKREINKEQHQSEVYFEDTSVFNKGWLPTYLVLAAIWSVHFISSISFGLIPLSAITAYVLFVTVRWILERKSYIKIQGSNLQIRYKSQVENIELHQIKKVSLRKNGRKRIAEIYDKNNYLLMSFPTRVFDYDTFIECVEELTDHLKEPPFLEKEYII